VAVDEGTRLAAASDAIAVRQETVTALAARVTVPLYDRRRMRRGVVHFGVGGFHRAHQAVYFDEIARRGISSDWGITGVGLRSWQMGVVLRAQDCLYTLIERDASGSRGRVIGSIVDYVHGADQREHLLQVLGDPATRLVTLTITGNGYNLDENGAFVADGDGVERDLADPQRPSTVFGFIVEALDRRRRMGARPFTVLSCDNIPANGRSARAMVVGYAALRDAKLAEWIADTVAFPSSVVDRITPETTPEERDELVHTLGVDCRWPVITERFSQWVVEDVFSHGRPPLDEVGAQFVDDVTPYELAKKRLLNGSHCAIGYLGCLAGHRTSAEVMADPAFAAFVRGLMGEIVPLLPAPPGLDVPAYAQTVQQRLENPAIADALSRLCRRGSVKMPSYLLPSLADALDARRPHRLLTLATAAYIRYLAGEDAAGGPIEVEDPRADELVEAARTSPGDPRPLLEKRDIFGGLADSPAFVAELEGALDALRAGPREAIGMYLDERQAA
jgi:fructuronate reductase/mannitol 2-dehydrogenase